MGRIFFCALCLIQIAAFTGCKMHLPDYRNIKDMIFAKVIVIDKSISDNNSVMITALYEPLSSGGESDSSSGVKRTAKISSEGKTVFDAVRNFDSFSNKKVFLGQVDYLLFSEEIAKEGLLKYMDFFTRYYEVNLNTDIFVVMGISTADFINAVIKSEGFISDNIRNLIENSGYLSISAEVKTKDIIRTLDQDYISAYLPALRLKEGKNDIEMDGYAIFGGEKLASYLTGSEARGFNWITDNITSGVVLVKGRDAKDIALEIHYSKTKITPVFDNNNLTITIYVNMASNISEQTSPENIYDEQTIEYLKRQQEQAIKQEIQNTLSLVKKNRADIFGIGDMVYHRYPVRWQSLKSNWMDTFAEQKFDVEVNSEIKRTYIIKQPTRSEINKNK